MGLGDLQIINSLKTSGYIPELGAVVDIGAQQLNDSFLAARAEIEEIGELFGRATPAPSFARSADATGDNILHGAPLARDFWIWLGMEYASIDIDGTPGSIPLDLNFDEVPKDAKGRYNLVTNFGTTEHTANQLQAFKIIHDLAALDGLMLHNVPMAGMPGHGFISYNPRFFWSLAHANGYGIVFMTLSRNEGSQPLPSGIMADIAKHDPSLAERFADYRSTECAIIVALQKKFDLTFVPLLDAVAGSTTDHVDLQSRYWSTFHAQPFLERDEEREKERKRRMMWRELAFLIFPAWLFKLRRLLLRRNERTPPEHHNPT
jgi:hypothetical protein